MASLLVLFAYAFIIGLLAIGGDYTVFASLMHYAIEGNITTTPPDAWSEAVPMADAIGMASILPGSSPLISMAAVAEGEYALRIAAALVSIAGFSLPPFISYAIVRRIEKTQRLKLLPSGAVALVRKMLPGILVGTAFAIIGGTNIYDMCMAAPWRTAVNLLLCAAVFIGVYKYRINPVLMLLLSGIAGILLMR